MPTRIPLLSAAFAVTITAAALVWTGCGDSPASSMVVPARATPPVDDNIPSQDASVEGADALDTVQVWRPIRVIRSHECVLSSGPDAERCDVTAIAFAPNAMNVATASYEGPVRVWQYHYGAQVAVLAGHTGKVAAVSFSPGGEHILTAGADATARIWRADTGENLAIIEHDAPLNAASYSPDGAVILTASGQALHVWDARTGELLRKLTGHTGSVTSAAYSPDGTLIVSTGEDAATRVWAPRSDEAVLVINHDNASSIALFSADGARIVTNEGDAALQLWDARTGERLGAIAEPTGFIFDVAANADATRLLVLGNGEGRLIDLGTMTTLATYDGYGQVAAFGDPAMGVIGITSAEELSVGDFGPPSETPPN